MLNNHVPIILRYNTTDRVLKVAQGDLMSCQLSENDEYISFSTGQSMSTFTVDDIGKSCTITKIGDGVNFERYLLKREQEFNLWEPFYTDIIMPGKREIIHKTTLIRSISYDNIRNDSINHHLETGDDFLKLISRLEGKKAKGQFSLNITYSFTPIVAALLPLLYLVLKSMLSNDKIIVFKPKNDWDLKRSCYSTINLNEYNKFECDIRDDCRWMVFSKTRKSMVYFTKTNQDACALLADIKFNSVVPFFTCGVALFEDYYFMPLVYDHIEIDSWSKRVLLSKPNKDVVRFQNELVKFLR